VARTRRGRAGTVWPVDWVSAVLCPVMCPPWHGSRRACSDAPQGDGYYRGAVYHGALQMLQDEGGRLLAGKWVGFGKDGEINDGARTVRPRRRPAESRQAPANPPVNPPGSDDPVSTTGVPLA